MSRSDVLSAFEQRLQSDADLMAFTFASHPDSAKDSDRVSYRQLDSRARRTAAWLEERTRPGDRVLLLHAPGVEFAASFFACLRAGVIAVPCSLPGRFRHERARLVGIARDSGAAAVLTDRRSRPDVEKWAADAGVAAVISPPTETLRGEPERDRPRVPVTPDTVAFLQYTSGSTGAPKGVMVTHGNVTVNTMSVRRAFGSTPGTRYGGWIPLHHDMGLIGLMLTGVLRGRGYVQMDPMAFLRRPHLWLRMLEAFDVNGTAAPDFGYELCLRRVTDEQLTGLDLSHVTQLANGSEPVRASTMERFCERFAPYGVRRRAMQPTYGLAEATLVVSGTAERAERTVAMDAVALERGALRRRASGAPARVLASCGRPVDCRVRIVDPGTHERLPAGRVGEIWLSGPGVTAGYWHAPEATRAVFHARTSEGDGPYLRTGDLGGVLDGDLFVTGRRKDVLVIHGRSLHPQDIEDELRVQHEELHGLRGAVLLVGGDDDTGLDPTLVVVHEIRGHWGERHRSDTATAMKHTIAREFGAPVGAVALVRPGGVRRTTSGKTQRAAMRALYLAGALDTLTLSEDPRLGEALRFLRARPGRPDHARESA